jgi:hypothetical protein
MECAVRSALWLSFPSGNYTPTNTPLWSAPSVRRFGSVSPQATTPTHQHAPMECAVCSALWLSFPSGNYTHPPIRPYGVRRFFGALAQFPLRQLHTPTNTPLWSAPSVRRFGWVSPQATTHTHQYAPMECAVRSALWLGFPSGNYTPTNTPLWSAPSVRRFGSVSPQATTHTHQYAPIECAVRSALWLGLEVYRVLSAKAPNRRRTPYYCQSLSGSYSSYTLSASVLKP